MNCDDCEGKMEELELARLTDDEGDVFTVQRLESGPCICKLDEPTGVDVALIWGDDALKLLDSANLNTTANELRAKLEEEQKQIEVTTSEVDGFVSVRFFGPPRDVARDMMHEVDGLRARLSEAHQTIAQLRQADTVRPAVDAAEVWDTAYKLGRHEQEHGFIIETPNPYR